AARLRSGRGVFVTSLLAAERSRRTWQRGSIARRRPDLLAQWLLQAGQHLLRHDLPEARQLARPVEQELLGEARLRRRRVLGDEVAQHAVPIRRGDALPYHRVGVDDGLEILGGVVDE